MSRLMRPLRQWPPLQHHNCCSRPPLHHLLSSLLPVPTTKTTDKKTSFRLSLTSPPSSLRNLHHRSRGLSRPNARPSPSDSEEEEEEDDESGSDSDAKKSRNQKKRDARRAVRWGMQLSAFSPLQIKRILRVTSLDDDVLEALMLVKRLGPDVREGKRRQFNYIGKLLREVESELMETLIQATIVGDHSTLQALAGQIVDEEDEESEETQIEEEEEVSHEYINIATRWFDGLIDKDVKITNEVYSIQSVDFDRQELRKLVKGVHASQRSQTIVEGNEGEVDAAFINAKKSLNRFLLSLAKRMSVNDV